MGNYEFDKEYIWQYGDSEIIVDKFEVNSNNALTNYTSSISSATASSFFWIPKAITHQWGGLGAEYSELIWQSEKIGTTDWTIVIYANAYLYGSGYGYSPAFIGAIKGNPPKYANELTTINDKCQFTMPPLQDYWMGRNNPVASEVTFNMYLCIKFAIDITHDIFASPFIALTNYNSDPYATNDLISQVNSNISKVPFMQWTQSNFNYSDFADAFLTAFKKKAPDYPGGGDQSIPINPNAGQINEPTDPTGIGTFDNTTTSIEVDNTTRVSAGISGKLLESYIISAGELSNLNEFLWSTDFSDIISKYLNGDPMKCITGIMTVPFDIPESNRGSIFDIYILNQNTHASGTRLTSLIAYIDCGEIFINAYWGNYLDYNTKILIYVPYCGMHELDINDVMSSIIGLSYKVDLMTGSCVATLYVTRGEGRAPLYTFSGSMGIEYPLTSADRSRLISATLGAISSPVPPNPSTVTSLVSAVAPSVSHTGGYNGNSGSLAPQQPYLVIRRQVQSLPESYSDYKGYPANFKGFIRDVRGFAKVSDIHLNIPCLSDEYDELLSILHEGFYVL